MTLEREESPSRADFYRQLLLQSRIFLTELDDEQSSTPSRRAKSASSLRSSPSSLRPSKEGNEEFSSTRQRCYQRLLACSRKKLRLLTIQEQVSLSSLLFSRLSH